jgi:hypothetical protein
MTDKEREELEVFLEFAERCHLPLLRDTAANRQPPEPDILCGLRDRKKIAFELVSAEDETADKVNPKKRVPADKHIDDNSKLKRAIEDAFFDAVNAGQIQNPERVHFHTIHVHFEDSASFHKSHSAIPEIIRSLNSAAIGKNFIRNGVIRVIEIDPYPSPCDYKGPMFRANRSGCGVSLTVVNRIKKKLQKKYQTAHPIQLLVYSNSAFAAEVDFWRADLLKLVAAEGMGRFDHIWVFGRHHASIVFDLARPK